MRKNTKGFTLVELTYSMMIVAVLTAVAAPRIDLDRIRVDSAATQVATSLMAAHQSAILKGHDVVVALNVAANRIRIHTDANNDGRIQSDEPFRVVELPDGIVFGSSGAPALGEGAPPITFLDRQGTLPCLTFHRNGSASEKGYLYLTGSGGGGQERNSRAIEVVRATAKVKCWSRHSGTWQEGC